MQQFGATKNASRRGRVLAACFLASSLLIPLPAFCQGGGAGGPLDESVRQSTFIFVGTVEKAGATTMAIVPVSPNTVVVRVEEILRAPAALGSYSGKEVTVYLIQPESLAMGARAIFFTKGWLLGDGVALQEVSHSPTERLAELRTQTSAAIQRTKDRDLQERIAQAQMVVTGRVTGVSGAASGGPVTEHDPAWQRATVDIQRVLKDTAQKTVMVYFPGSMDVMFYQTPRFKPGDEGIWLLRLDPSLKGYTALNPLDFQPKKELPRISALLRSARMQPKK